MNLNEEDFIFTLEFGGLSSFEILRMGFYQSKNENLAECGKKVCIRKLRKLIKLFNLPEIVQEKFEKKTDHRFNQRQISLKETEPNRTICGTKTVKRQFKTSW